MKWPFPPKVVPFKLEGIIQSYNGIQVLLRSLTCYSWWNYHNTKFRPKHGFKFQNLSSHTNISQIGRRAALYVSMIFSRTNINEFWYLPLLFFALVNSLAFSTSAAAFFRSTFSFFSNISSFYRIQEAKHSEWKKKTFLKL